MACALAYVLADGAGVGPVGGVAQLGEHLLCKQGVVGSIPSTSTTPRSLLRRDPAQLAASGPCAACCIGTLCGLPCGVLWSGLDPRVVLLVASCFCGWSGLVVTEKSESSMGSDPVITARWVRAVARRSSCDAALRGGAGRRGLCQCESGSGASLGARLSVCLTGGPPRSEGWVPTTVATALRGVNYAEQMACRRGCRVCAFSLGGERVWMVPVHGGRLPLRGGGHVLERDKGIRWMPWHQEAMKDVARCDKPWGAASRL